MEVHYCFAANTGDRDMSNCVSFDKGELDFKAHEIDGLGLMEEVRNHVDHGESCNSIHKYCSGFYWYLTPDNVVEQDGNVRIYLGEGRSNHTWRDFQYVVKIISNFVKKEKKFNLVMRDEYDGFRSKFKMEIVIGPGYYKGLEEVIINSLDDMVEAYRVIHEYTPPFEGKNTVNFVLMQAIVKYAKKCGRLEEVKNYSLFSCEFCQQLFKASL